jgi:hypothetical protein
MELAASPHLSATLDKGPRTTLPGGSGIGSIHDEGVSSPAEGSPRAGGPSARALSSQNGSLAWPHLRRP